MPSREGLGAELRDGVARVDALRAALVAEVAARAVPDAVGAVEVAQAARGCRGRARRRRSGTPSPAPPAPRKSGSASIELHSETQQPHMMQSDSLWIPSAARAGRATRLLAGSSSCASRYGLTARILRQKGSMSTTRSLITGRLPIGATVMTWPASTYGFIDVLQPSTAPPSTRMPHEPQTAMRQLLRYASVPSLLVLDDVERVQHRRRHRHLDGVRLVAVRAARLLPAHPHRRLHRLDAVGADERGEVRVGDLRHAQ